MARKYIWYGEAETRAYRGRNAGGQAPHWEATKKKAEKQSKRIMVYLTPDEYKQFEAKAKEEDLSLAALIMRPWREKED